MKRHDRQLHRKGKEEPEHDPESGARAHRRCEQIGVAESEHSARVVVHEHERQNRHQHHQAGRLRENEELDRCIKPRPAAGNIVAPERDQEEHRYQHDFPEQEEEEQIRRQKDADHARQVPQHVHVEEAGVGLDLSPGAGHRQQAEQRRERHEQQRQSVESQAEADPEARNPGHRELLHPVAGLRPAQGEQGV